MSAVRLDGRVALARDDVRVGYDDARRGDPTGALDREPASRAEHADDAATGGVNIRVADDSPGRSRNPGLRAAYVREWIGPGERVQERARWRKQAVQRAEHSRALDVL